MENLVHFFSTDAGFAAAFSAVATIIATFIGQALRGRVRLIWFSPNSTRFQLRAKESPDQITYVNSGQIIVQNSGRQSATNVQITSSPGGAPAGYVLIPSIVHQTHVGPGGEWIVQIPFISSGEVITLQILNGPPIESVRCSQSMGKLVPVSHQRLYPKPFQLTIAFLMLTGIASIFYSIGYIIANWN